jgi:hypothetical protein
MVSGYQVGKVQKMSVFSTMDDPLVYISFERYDKTLQGLESFRLIVKDIDLVHHEAGQAMLAAGQLVDYPEYKEVLLHCIIPADATFKEEDLRT